MVSTMLGSGPRRVDPIEGVERVLGNGKRVFAETYKQSLVERCLQAGTSVSRVALEHGINANLLRKWIDKRTPRSSGVAMLVPVTIKPTTDEVRPAAAALPSARAPSSVIEIEIGKVRVRLRGEVDAQRLAVVLEALARRSASCWSAELGVPDHTTVSRGAIKLASVARTALPEGPLHVVIDSTGLKIYGAGSGRPTSLDSARAASIASCTWRCTRTAARSWP
jgi:transposase